MMIYVYDDNFLRATCVHSSLITKRTTQYVNNVRKYLYTREKTKVKVHYSPSQIIIIQYADQVNF